MDIHKYMLNFGYSEFIKGYQKTTYLWICKNRFMDIVSSPHFFISINDLLISMNDLLISMNTSKFWISTSTIYIRVSISDLLISIVIYMDIHK